MNKNLNIIRKKLHSYGLSPTEVEILLIFAQNDIIQASKVSELVPAALRLKGPRLYHNLKQLSQKGWLYSVGANPLMYRFADPTEIRSVLESVILKNQQQVEKQKNNYYEVISTFDDLHQDFLGNQKTTSELLTLPSQVLASFKSLIFSIHDNTPMTFFNGEYNAIIVLNKENVQFRLNAVEFQWTTGSSPLYAGSTICEIDPVSERADILEFIHNYNVNGLKFKYKLESKGYVENKARKFSQYQFSEITDASENSKTSGISGPSSKVAAKSPQEEKILVLSTAFDFHVNNLKKTGWIQTRQLSAANEDKGLEILTFWVEDPLMLPWIEYYWEN